MSGGEVVLSILSVIITAVGWLRWSWPVIAVSRLHCGGGHRAALVVLPFASAALLFAVLRWLAADDVRDDARYLLMYQALGGAWALSAAELLPWFGYSLRDDVLERRNGAALWAIGGAMLGLTLCFAGGNIGNGPGWWVVIFAAALSTGAFLALWLCFEWIGRPGEAITLDRDHAAGLRLAGFLVSAGSSWGVRSLATGCPRVPRCETFSSARGLRFSCCLSA